MKLRLSKNKQKQHSVGSIGTLTRTETLTQRRRKKTTLAGRIGTSTQATTQQRHMLQRHLTTTNWSLHHTAIPERQSSKDKITVVTASVVVADHVPHRVARC